AAPKGSCMTSAIRAMSGAYRLLERRRKMGSHVETRLFGDLDETRWAGDVDLGDIIANDVQADQQQSALDQLRTDGLCDFAVARRELAGDAPATRRQIASGFAGQGNAGQHIRHRLPGDQQYALVAVDDFGNVALRHDGA